MSEVIGFCGLGRMGQAMVRSLLEAGFEVRVWNRTPGKAPEGTEEARTPRELAEGPRIVITMLADDAAVEHVVFGPDGILAGLREGAIHLGMSTISMQLAERLAQAHRHARQRFVAAPVFGRPEAAAKKQLWIVPGGDNDAIKDCAPIFEALGQGTFPMGTAAHAALAKLIGNFMLASTIEMLGEGLALGEKAGMNAEKLVEMLAGTIFGSAVVKNYGPRIARTEFEPPGFTVRLGLKDVTLAMKAAEELKVPMPLASLDHDHLMASLAKGREGWDFAGFVAVVREMAGLPTRH